MSIGPRLVSARMIRPGSHFRSHSPGTKRLSQKYPFHGDGRGSPIETETLLQGPGGNESADSTLDSQSHYQAPQKVQE